MKTPYANAREVLPEALFLEVQKHFTGNLYIESPNNFYRGRKELVVELYKQGQNTRQISDLAGVSVRRINQILEEARQKGDIPSTYYVR